MVCEFADDAPFDAQKIWRGQPDRKVLVSGGDVRAAISWLREDSLGFTSQRVRKWLGVAGELQFDEAPRTDRRGAWIASVSVRYCLTFFYQLCRADLRVRNENDGEILIGKVIFK